MKFVCRVLSGQNITDISGQNFKMQNRIFKIFVLSLIVSMNAFFITQFMQSPLPHKILVKLNKDNSTWSVSNDLFTQSLDKKDILLIGDKDFVRQVKTLIGNKNKIYKISSYEGAINTVAEAHALIDVSIFKMIIIQNRPFYWSDYWASPVRTYGKFGYVSLWNEAKKSKIISRSAVRLFFQFIKIAVMPSNKNLLVKHPDSMAGITWFDWPLDDHFHIKNLRKKILADKTFWIRDLNNLPDDLPEEILTRFNERFGHSQNEILKVEGLGFSLDMKKLSIILKKQ